MLTITLDGQNWFYVAEAEKFGTIEQDGAREPVYRTYADWQRIFPA